MINWGIIGLGNIAHTFAEAIKEISACKLKGIASLNKSKLTTFGEKYNIDQKYRFNSYDELINSDEIDAVYIATLNNTHKDLIIKSIDARKNILCEKPITINDQEIKDVYKKVKDSKIFFLEAIAYRSHPISKAIFEILSNDNFGKIENIITSFGFDTKRIKPESRLYNKMLGGGAILDVGCYPLSIVNLIKKTRNENSKIIFLDVKGNICKTGVDDYSFAKLKFSKDSYAEIEIAIRKKLENSLYIKTTYGELKIPNLWLPNKKVYIDVKLRDHFYKQFITCDYTVYAQQINFFNSMIKNNEKPTDFPYLSLEDSKEIAELSLEWRKRLY